MKNKFRKFVTGKSFFIILSVVLAVASWIAVLGITNPIITRSVEVPIEFLNENAPSILDLKDMTVTYPKTATVTVSGRQDTLNNLNASEISLTCDLEAITKAGETTLEVTRPVCERVGVTVNDYYPKSITFNYDKTAKKNLDVRIEYDSGLLRDGYEFISVTSSLSSIPVAGMASLLDTCDYVRVDLSDSIENGTLDSNKNAAFLVKYISTAGENITRYFPEEKVTVEIQVGKRIFCDAAVTGTPAESHYYNGLTLDPATLLVQGNPELLKQVDYIDFGGIDVSGAENNVVREYRIADFLPSGVTPVGVQTVTVTAEVSEYVVKTFEVPLSALTIPGRNDSLYDYDISPSSYSVRVRGNEEDMALFTLASAVPTVNLEKRTVGVYNVPLTFGSLDTSKYTIVGEYIYSVKISEKITETPVPPTQVPTPVPTEVPTPVPTEIPTPVPTPTEEPHDPTAPPVTEETAEPSGE